MQSVCSCRCVCDTPCPLPCGACKMIKDSVLGGNMSICKHEYVHYMSLCGHHKRRRVFITVCLRRLFGREKSRRCHGKTEERCIARGCRIKREQSTKQTSERVPHLLSSWLMLMYISQVVSSAIPPWGTNRLIPAEERGVWKLISAWLTHGTHLLSCQVSLLRLTARGVMAPERGDRSKSQRPCESELPALSLSHPPHPHTQTSSFLNTHIIIGNVVQYHKQLPPIWEWIKLL